jgi:hypothetical protein
MLPPITVAPPADSPATSAIPNARVHKRRTGVIQSPENRAITPTLFLIVGMNIAARHWCKRHRARSWRRRYRAVSACNLLPELLLPAC